MQLNHFENKTHLKQTFMFVTIKLNANSLLVHNFLELSRKENRPRSFQSFQVTRKEIVRRTAAPVNDVLQSLF